MSKLSLGVEKAATGPADIRDQRWLDERIAEIDDGIDAVLDIARNWTAGRNLSRLHRGSAQDYILLRVKSPLGRGVVVPLLTESNWSNRQIAAVAGLSHERVNQLARELPVERPTETLGADGKLRPAPRWDPGAGLMSSDSPEWYTPRHVVETVITALGAIDLDPCADPGRTVPAGRHFTEADDGLTHEWTGRVYMNPPYGRTIGDWTGKLRVEHDAGRVTEAVVLVPARTETDWWESLQAEWLCLIHGRLAFSEHLTAAPFPSAALYLGDRGEAFAEAFAPLGPVYRRIFP